MKKIIGIVLLTGGGLLFLSVLYLNSNYNGQTRPFSEYTLLSSSWDGYKKKFINQDGRVLDLSQDDITTSEGQSYAMLRSVWMDDRPTFDLVYKWTKENLKRPNDELFGWRWGNGGSGKYGFIEGGGENAAADADVDTALALILASRRWKDPQYIQDAKAILESIWKIETGTANGKRYLIAGNWAKNEQELILNPSYFAPYAYRIFSEVDKEHDWNSLIDPAYELLQQSSEQPLDKNKSVGLPPDWVKISISDGTLSSTNMNNLTTNYSYDALRVPFRIALDYSWYKEERAKKYLNNFNFLKDLYEKTNQLATGYSHDGEMLDTYENPSMYATFLAYLYIDNPDLAKKVYQEKIISLYSNDQNTFNDDLPYYEQNWLWFSVAFVNNQLVNYTDE